MKHRDNPSEKRKISTQIFSSVRPLTHILEILRGQNRHHLSSHPLPRKRQRSPVVNNSIGWTTDLIYQILRTRTYGYPPSFIPFSSMIHFLQSPNPIQEWLQTSRIAILQTLSKIISIQGQFDFLLRIWGWLGRKRYRIEWESRWIGFSSK